MKHYLIGEVSKILPISKDTLRYYDRLGLVSPKKSATNHYRYYTKDDLLTLSYVLILRDLEIPLEEIKARLHNSTLEDFRLLLENQELVIESKILNLLRLKEHLHDFKQDIMTAQTYFRKIECIISPSFVYKSLSTEFDPSYTDILTEMEEHPLISSPNYSALLSQDAFFNQCHFDLYALSGMVKNEKDLDKLQGYQSFKSTLCVHTILIIGDTILQSDLDALYTYLKAHGLTIKGEVLARYLAFEHHEGTPYEYYELFIPVKALTD